MNMNNSQAEPRYWMCHWKNKFWQSDLDCELQPIKFAAGNEFASRGVQYGDVVYIVSIKDGKLLLAGKMIVDRIVSYNQILKLYGEPAYRASEYLISKEDSATPRNYHRQLSTEVSQKLRFVSDESESSLYFEDEDRLYRQATRKLRNFTKESAKLLDRIIELTDQVPFTASMVTVTDKSLASLRQISNRKSELFMESRKTVEDTWGIYVFGNPLEGKYGFSNDKEFEMYIRAGIFSEHSGRYQHTLRLDPRIIVLSRKGLAFGHFEIAGYEQPNESDKKSLANVKRTYLVKTSILYDKPVRLIDHSIKGINFGNKIKEQQLDSLVEAALGCREFSCGVSLPESPNELERAYRAVAQRMRQTEFRKSLLKAYHRQCAITRCEVIEALQAAHIDPWANAGKSDAMNGILLRSDVHTLFDRDLIAIEPTELIVHVAKKIRETEYGQFHKIVLNVPEKDAYAPDKSAFKKRWDMFLRNQN